MDYYLSLIESRASTLMAENITPVIANLLARNKGSVPGNPQVRQTPNYGVTASLEGAVLEMMLTFRAGSAYCCCQSGCHFGAFEGKRWERLREEMQAHGFAPPERLQIRLSVVVEKGAMFFDGSRPDRTRRGWYEFAPVEEQRYQRVLNEAEPILAQELYVTTVTSNG